jgi:hypothetical protein
LQPPQQPVVQLVCAASRPIWPSSAGPPAAQACPRNSLAPHTAQLTFRPKPPRARTPAPCAADRWDPRVIPSAKPSPPRTPPPPSPTGARLLRVARTPRPGPRDYLRPPHPPGAPTRALAAALASSATRRNPSPPPPRKRRRRRSFVAVKPPRSRARR